MRLRAIDSHTEGEPTRVILEGQLPIRAASMAEYVVQMRDRFDWVRSGAVLEPRGHSAVVGALLTPPVNPGSLCGVVFFNNAGYLRMCGHGTIGVAETLFRLGGLGSPAAGAVDTVAGSVSFSREESGEVSLQNVVSYRYREAVGIEVPGVGRVVGDVAWGGNWFFIAHWDKSPIRPREIRPLTDIAWRIRHALVANGVTGQDGAEIDHVELSGPSSTVGVNARSFVLCPGGEFDRSPCGTGTSAVMACLAETGQLAEDQVWVQESVTGGVFRGSVRRVEGGWLPTIRGRAFITAESTLVFEDSDPYRAGIRIE